ncbi:hypothetical protein NDU88_002740 [Pleurodeles waltl]|uniref:Uncharacterized protein n=1 Tax=Pleurodeles waltl TaxID=8319 RepID=A0AAV7KTN8_PLEWA|nr:hypothetical protein NDU88_002740 [Pleurodeles waltl]
MSRRLLRAPAQGEAVIFVAGYIVAASSPPAAGYIVAAGCYIENIVDTVVVADGLHAPSEECALARSRFRLRATDVFWPRTPILEIFRCGFTQRLEFFFYYRRLAFGIYCSNASLFWRVKGIKMPPKGAKNTTLTGRGKPLRINESIRQRATADIKHGSGEKTNPKTKNASLDRFLERGKDISVGGIDARAPSAVVVADQLTTIEMEADEGRGADLRLRCSVLKKACCQQSGFIASRDNEITQGDKLFSLSDPSSLSSNEQLDLEADKTSSELDSEMSSLVLGKESHESSKNATVRKKQRKRSEQLGLNKHSTNSLDTKGLQWEYSKGDLTLHDNTEKQSNPVSLETIYQSIMEHREESKSESHRTQLACRKMQIQIQWVAKTCLEFATRMEEVETRISHLEDDAGSQQVTQEAMEKQLEDTQWKLTDLEDRLMRNNLRVLGIPEGAEGSDTHSFMVALFKEAFPDLQQWDWDREIQRAHQFPFNGAGLTSAVVSGRPRAMLISLLNFQARQAVYDRA